MDAIKHFTEGMIKENKPQFEVGDTVRVSVRIKEGDKERIQAFEGHRHCQEAWRHCGDLHRSPYFLRRWCGACVPRQQPVRGEGRSCSPRQGSSCEALLPA